MCVNTICIEYGWNRLRLTGHGHHAMATKKEAEVKTSASLIVN